MDRYLLLRGDVPSKNDIDNNKVITTGLDSLITGKIRKYYPIYIYRPGHKVTVQIIKPSPPRKIFQVSDVHWHTSCGYYLCKKHVCCSIKSPQQRYGCVIFLASLNTLSYLDNRFCIFLFSQSLFSSIVRCRSLDLLTERALIISPGRTPYQPIIELGSEGLTHEVDPQEIDQLHDGIKESMAKDLTLEEIKGLKYNGPI